MRQVFCIRVQPKISFFNRNEIFKINKRAGINNGKTSYYWVEKTGKRIKDRFFRQELFAPKGQFE